MEAEIIQIRLNDACLTAKVYSPPEPKGLVIVAEGEDCKQLKVENEHLFKALRRKNIATLFTYLLDPPGEQEYDIPFDIDVMSQHLQDVTEWIGGQRSMERMAIGYFAANTAAAAALKASVAPGSRVKAIVSHCGRPDLSGPHLPLVKAATMLITSSDNVYLTELNWQGYKGLTCEKELVTLQGGPRSFEKGRNARKITQMAADWFDRHLELLPVKRKVGSFAMQVKLA